MRVTGSQGVQIDVGARGWQANYSAAGAGMPRRPPSARCPAQGKRGILAGHQGWTCLHRTGRRLAP